MAHQQTAFTLRQIEDNAITDTYNNLINVGNNPGMIFYGASVISMMQDSLEMVIKHGMDNESVYNVTPKLDGVRMLMMVHPSHGVIFIDRKVSFFEVIDKTTNEKYSSQFSIDSVYLFDGEYYEHKNSNGDTVSVSYFVFDILIDNNEPVYNYMFVDRYENIKKLFNRENKFFKSVILPIFNTVKLNIVYKLYFDFKFFKKIPGMDLYEIIKQYFNETYNNEYVFDGLIFTPRFTKYIVGGNWKYPSNVLFKWKPAHDETIDFSFPGKSNTFAHVFSATGKRVPWKVYDNRRNAIKMKISNSSINGLRNHNRDKVYECRYNETTDTFDIIRERPDKHVPNTVSSANNSWKLINSPININNILPFIIPNYYEGNTINEEHYSRDISNIFTEYQTKQLALECKSISLIDVNDVMIKRYNKQSMKNTNSDIKHEFEIRFGIFHQNKTMPNNDWRFNSIIERRHFNWLKLSLEVAGVPFHYSETVDAFGDNNLRTTYFLKKNDEIEISNTVTKIPMENNNISEFQSIYKYGFRVSIAVEKHETDKKVDLETAKFTRNKMRTSFRVDDDFRIDMTEYRESRNGKCNNSSCFQVELESTSRSNYVDIMKLNHFIKYILKNLYGMNQII
ncbi:putative mRNA capping enzyme [Heterosigma akashiwo virus 01]|uniref:Putative mRNA capping enzyme n=1 Tax=Heterosigma akashiwo virus 01 TaxID=97195 RepID=A0A1C9C565_HAV01|nr:putative mRNA capping enzyme [Heterosigma akashiwo virus 01]AOM63429.1 putative mRNA capping enzyme [Heterosigma akashiwo virus 01]